MCATIVEKIPGQKHSNADGLAATNGGKESVLADFRRRYPDYDHEAIEALRLSEYGRLDELAQTYLDYTGGGLHCSSQLSRHFETAFDHRAWESSLP